MLTLGGNGSRRAWSAFRLGSIMRLQQKQATKPSTMAPTGPLWPQVLRGKSGDGFTSQLPQCPCGVAWCPLGWASAARWWRGLTVRPHTRKLPLISNAILREETVLSYSRKLRV
jgi:hypothetical protein